MKLLSFIDEHEQWIPVEVELELWPGLPEIHFLGRPDQHLRESAKRIKSAIKAQGFEFPVGQQILVNLRPSYLKKSSRGIELAVAAAFLMESGQMPKWVADSKTFLYGELSLSGEVTAPAGLAAANLPPGAVLITGSSREGVPFAFSEVQTLKDLFAPVKKSASWVSPTWEPPKEVLDLEITKSWAKLLGIIALGEHSVLFAGAAGAGKTTAGRILHALMPTPNEEEAKDLWRASHGFYSELSNWRPLIQPHHTIPTLSLLGGGSEAHGGELARADRGLLLLDEFFEFSPMAMEALREPLEQKKMRVSRGTRVREYPMRAQVVATTNLCPCGDYVPGESNSSKKVRCRFTLGKCNSYAQKISGPLLDRFEVLAFVKNPPVDEQKVSVRALRKKVDNIRRHVNRGKLALLDEILQIQKRMDPLTLQDWQSRQSSQRRRIATLKVAQSLCDWEGGSGPIKGTHLDDALKLTYHSFEQVRRWDLSSV